MSSHPAHSSFLKHVATMNLVGIFSENKRASLDFPSLVISERCVSLWAATEIAVFWLVDC